MTPKFSLEALQSQRELQVPRTIPASDSALSARPRRRRNRVIERALTTEHIWRCKALGIIAIPIPNGIWLRARTDQEKELAARMVHRLKTDGMLLPSAPDLVVMNARGAGLIELKRGPTRDLFRTLPAGRPSDDQLEFAALCQRLGVNHTFSESWGQSLEAMRKWGMID